MLPFHPPFITWGKRTFYTLRLRPEWINLLNFRAHGGGGARARPKIHLRTRHCTRVHRLGVQKRAKFEKKGVCFGSYKHILERT